METVVADVEARVKRILGSKRFFRWRAELYHDLHIAGDDASELLNGIKTAYGTCFQGFVFDDYFAGETESTWLFWRSRLGWRDNRRKSLTIEHLIAVVQRGAWFEPSVSRA